MKTSVEDKIKNIYSERTNLIDNTKMYMRDNSVNMIENVESLMDIDFDTKEYSAITKAKEMILSLTDEIRNANTLEEMVSIRKKINYNINKIKKILKNRNVIDEAFEKYSENAFYLRKDMAKYVRTLKREDNLNEIEILQNKESLTADEKNRLKKLLKNELNFIKRNSSFKYDYVPSKKKDKKESPDLSELTFYDNDTNQVIDYEKLNKIFDDFKEEKLGESVEEEQHLIFLEGLFEEDTKPLDSNPEEVNFELRYNVKQSKRYNKNKFINVIRLMRNVPVYLHNNKEIKKMKYDYNYYFHSELLKKYISKCHDENSIKKALEVIFSKTKQTSYANEDEKTLSLKRI